MKKLILTIVAVTVGSLAAYSQGTVYFENNAANGYVVTSANGDQSSVVGAYGLAANFTTQLLALSGNVQSTVGLGIDAYGFLNPNNVVSDGFIATSLGPISGSAGAFFVGPSVTVSGSAGLFPFATANPGSTVVAMVAWTGSYATFAAALTAWNSGLNYMGAMAFEQQLGPGGTSPVQDIAQGWGVLANSPQCAAQGGISGSIQDLIMVQNVPEPTTMALLGLGGLGLLLFRRRQ